MKKNLSINLLWTSGIRGVLCLVAALCALSAMGQRVAVGVESRLQIDGEQGKLQAVLSMPRDGAQDSVPCAVLMHGFMGKKDSRMFELIADSLAAHGVASLRFDFQGHGESEGRFEDMTVPGEVVDALMVIRYLRAQPWVGDIVIAGHSQGGVVASMVAGEMMPDTISAVVLMAPAAVLRDDAIRGNTMGSTYDPLDPPETVDLFNGLKLGAGYIRTAFYLPIYETAARYHGPACIIHGTGDRIVPYTYGLRYHQLWRGSEYHELPGYDHGFTQDLTTATRLASDFLIKTLKNVIR